MLLPTDKDKIIGFKAFTVDHDVIYRGYTFNRRPLAELNIVIGPISKESKEMQEAVDLDVMKRIQNGMMERFGGFDTANRDLSKYEFILLENKNLKVLITHRVDGIIVYVRIDKSNMVDAFGGADLEKYSEGLGDVLEEMFGGGDVFEMGDGVEWDSPDVTLKNTVNYTWENVKHQNIRSIKHHKLFGKNNFMLEVGKIIEINRGWGLEKFIIHAILKESNRYSILAEDGYKIIYVYIDEYGKIEETNFK